MADVFINNLDSLDEADWKPYELSPDFTFGEVQFFRGSEDSTASAGIWRVSEAHAVPPELPFEFAIDEFLYIPYGEVDVELEGGELVELRPGTVVTFEAGLRTVWRFRKLPFAEVFSVTGRHYDGRALHDANRLEK